MDRPSRFDRKYHFELPELEERIAYLTLWQRKLEAKLSWSDGATAALAAQTEGFSFAYIKELVVTALMRAVGGESPFEAILRHECAKLSADMKTSKALVNVVRIGPRAVEDPEE